MNATSSVQTVRKNRVNSASASSLSAPRPSNSLRRVVSQFASSVLYCWTLRARPRATGQTGRIEDVEQHGVRHQARHAAVALHKGMHP